MVGFSFACMGLLLDYLKVTSNSNRIYSHRLFGYFGPVLQDIFLSTLLVRFSPFVIYILTAISAIVQVVIWYLLFKTIIKENKSIFVILPGYLKYLILFISFALWKFSFAIGLHHSRN